MFFEKLNDFNTVFLLGKTYKNFLCKQLRINNVSTKN